MKQKFHLNRRIDLLFSKGGILLTILFLTVFPFYLTAQQDLISLAVLPFENMNGNPEQDYLKGLITSILVEDLSGSEALLIVERENLEEVLKEQKLQFTGFIDDEGAIEAGLLLGASFMLKGSYVFLGQDIFINITLIDVETGGTRTFSERGYQENTVHALSEKLLEFMIGSTFTLQNPSGERAILALEQQEPGIVELYSYIVDARVFIDEEFVGYTTGDSKVPLILTLPPGRHTIRVHLTQNFGVIDTPEVTFRDWQEQFNLLPKEKIVLEDGTRHFNDLLSKMRQLIRKDLRIVPGKEEQAQISHSLEFTDREGKEVKIELDLKLKETENPENGGQAEIFLKYQDESYSFEYFAPAGKNLEFSEEVGKIRLDVDLECYASYRWELDYSIFRTDIRQGMHRE